MKLPTREDCKKIVKKEELFFCHKQTVDGTAVEIYGYHGCPTYKRMKELDAFDVRGITFVDVTDYHNLSLWQKVKRLVGLDYKVWERNLSMRKFFNMGEHDGITFDKLKDVEIKDVQTKEDGSQITFVKVGNRFYPKSKYSFHSDQVEMVKNIIGCDSFVDWQYVKFIENTINNPVQFKDIKNYFTFPYVLNDSIVNNAIFFFELVSPFNQIVVDYKSTELRLIQIRDAFTGEIFFHNKYNPNPPTLKELYEKSKLIEGNENTEGYVIYFKNGEVVKLKNAWYTSLHGVFTENLQVNDLMCVFANSLQDDMYAKLTGEKLAYVKALEEKYNSIIKILSQELIDLYNSFYEEHKGDRKSFALKSCHHRMFPPAVRAVTRKIDNFNLKDYAYQHANQKVKDECYRLHDAKRFIETFELGEMK